MALLLMGEGLFVGRLWRCRLVGIEIQGWPSQPCHLW